MIYFAASSYICIMLATTLKGHINVCNDMYNNPNHHCVFQLCHVSTGLLSMKHSMHANNKLKMNCI